VLYAPIIKKGIETWVENRIFSLATATLKWLSMPQGFQMSFTINFHHISIQYIKAFKIPDWD